MKFLLWITAIVLPISAAFGGTEVPVCKVWHTSDDYQIYIGRDALVTIQHGFLKNDGDLTKDLADELDKLHRSGICQGTYLVTDPHGLFLRGTLKQESDQFAAFLAYEAPTKQEARAIPPPAPVPAPEIANKRSNIPSRPEMLEVREKNGFLVGGVSEIRDDSGIYISASHVLEGNTEKALRHSFSESGLILDNYEFCHATRQGSGLPLDSKGSEELDVVIAVPKSKEGQIFDRDIDSQKCHQGDEAPRWKLKNITDNGKPILASSIKIGDQYFSYMYGSLGPKADESVKVASGIVNEEQPFGTFDIAPFASQSDAKGKVGGDTQPTTRGSGAIVYTESSTQSNSTWKIGGIIACEYPSAKTKTGLDLPGKVKVISIPELREATFSCGSISEAIRVRKRPKDCVPIDGRNSGGG